VITEINLSHCLETLTRRASLETLVLRHIVNCLETSVSKDACFTSVSRTIETSVRESQKTRVSIILETLVRHASFETLVSRQFTMCRKTRLVRHSSRETLVLRHS